MLRRKTLTSDGSILAGTPAIAKLIESLKRPHVPIRVTTAITKLVSGSIQYQSVNAISTPVLPPRDSNTSAARCK